MTSLAVRARWSPYLCGDGPLGEMVMGLAPADRALLARKMRDIYLSNHPDGPRSFISAAWICKGTVPG